MRPAVLLTRRIPDAVLSRLREACAVDLHEADAPIARGDLLSRVRGKQALLCLLTDRVDRDVLEAGSDLEIVANIAVGYDNIDVAEARARGIPVTNTPDVLTESTAEFTWALILAVTRRVGEGERRLRSGAWKGWALDFMLGMELRGKQLGVVGLGRIGSAVAARARAFGMRVAACSLDAPGAGPGRTSRVARRPSTLLGTTLGLPKDREPEIETMPLDRLLATSDVVTLHVPLTPGTRHLIDGAALSRMKPSGYLVNTARGPVVDEEALVRALAERRIAGAALDVYEREPAVHPGLLDFDSVVLAPHLGSATVEARTAMADLAVDNVLAVLGGRAPLTPVTA